jgi:predicted dehydrogenase
VTPSLRLGVVGCGAIASLVHLRSARSFPDVRVVGLADPLSAALEGAAALAPEAALFGSVDELLAESAPDAVVVATPSGTHSEIASAVLDAGVHLYLEKPIATDLDAAESLARRAADAGVIAAVGFNRRFHPVVQQAQWLIGAGRLAQIVEVETMFSEPIGLSSMPAWKTTRRSGGGSPLDLASHHVDTIRLLLGRELEATGGELRSVRSDLDDCVLSFRAGACRITVGCSFVRPREDRLTLRDASGRLLVLDRVRGRLTLGRRRVRVAALREARLRAILRPGSDPSYRPALLAFVDCARGSVCAIPLIATDGLASVRAIVEAERLATTGAER